LADNGAGIALVALVQVLGWWMSELLNHSISRSYSKHTTDVLAGSEFRVARRLILGKKT